MTKRNRQFAADDHEVEMMTTTTRTIIAPSVRAAVAVGGGVRVLGMQGHGV